MRKKRKQRENPCSTVVTPLPPVDPSQERRVKRRRDHPSTIASDLASSGNNILQAYADLLIISFICSPLTILFSVEVFDSGKCIFPNDEFVNFDFFVDVSDDNGEGFLYPDLATAGS